MFEMLPAPKLSPVYPPPLRYLKKVRARAFRLLRHPCSLIVVFESFTPHTNQSENHHDRARMEQAEAK